MTKPFVAFFTFNKCATFENEDFYFSRPLKQTFMFLIHKSLCVCQ